MQDVDMRFSQVKLSSHSSHMHYKLTFPRKVSLILLLQYWWKWVNHNFNLSEIANRMSSQIINCIFLMMQTAERTVVTDVHHWSLRRKRNPHSPLQQFWGIQHSRKTVQWERGGFNCQTPNQSKNPAYTQPCDGCGVCGIRELIIFFGGELNDSK